MGASTATRKRKSKDKSNQKQAKGIKEVVSKKLGLKTTVPGPFDYMKDEKKTLAYNLEGKDRKFYGKEASKLTNDEMVKRGLVKEGNYFKQEGGNFIRISKKEGQRLYAAGDSSISRSVQGNSNAKTIKFGKSSGAMGSGDPTGAMTSIPISKEMLQRQNKIIGLTTAALSFAVPGIGGTALRYNATKSLADAAQSQPAYNEYMSKFQAKQSGKKFTSTRNLFGLLQTQHSKKTLGQ